MLDSTAQGKAISFPTDSKLHASVIKTARRIAAKANLALRQSYTRTVPKLLQPSAAGAIPAPTMPRDALAAGRYSLQTWLHELADAGLIRPVALEPVNTGYFKNWNSPADCQAESPSST